MYSAIVTGLETLNQLLTAGIAITAFSLLIYALTFNLRDRVARSFAMIMVWVVVTFVGDAIGSISATPVALGFWLRIQWVGIIMLPATYLHISDALLETTGRPSRGRRRMAVRWVYLISLAFLVALPLGWLVGPLIPDAQPVPHLERTWLSWVFSAYYAFLMLWAGVNFIRAYQRTVARVSRRRMGYLLIGALSPALGSYPYLLFGSSVAAAFPLLFWVAATVSNILASIFIIVMAYAVAFFGVPWPDRVVKRRLFKWLMRGPVTASTVLAITTLVRRVGQSLGLPAYNAIVPIIMVASVLILEHMITLAAPLWERWLFHSGDHSDVARLQQLEERLLTTNDLRQFLEAILAAVCDRLQVETAFLAGFGVQGLEMIVAIGDQARLEKEDLSAKGIQDATQNGMTGELFAWGDFWLVPLKSRRDPEGDLLGLLAILRTTTQSIDAEQAGALSILAERAALALEDRQIQQEIFISLEEITPDMEMIQQLRAAARYEGRSSLSQVLTQPSISLEHDNLTRWVKEALTHYWGGPKLTESPLLKLNIVQQALDEHEDNPTNALRSILRKAVEQVRPEGERRFTAEWILYNILEMKFMEGRKVREVALRLAMSEADLYRKQRVAVEAVANAIRDMEQEVLIQPSVATELATSTQLKQQGGFNGKS